MKKVLLVLTVAALSMFVVSTAFAAPSTKFTATIAKTEVMDTCSNSDEICGPVTDEELVATVKVPQKKDLLIGVSIQTGIDTSTKVTGKFGGGGSATATGEIKVTVSVCPVGQECDPADEMYQAEPKGGVIFDSRTQTLEAVLGGVLDTCTCTVDDNGVCVIDVDVNCEATDEMISLLLETVGAHHFNFVAPNLNSGEYTVTVYATIMTDAGTNDVLPGEPNTSNAKAVVGPRIVTIQTVRGSNNPDSITVLD